MVDRNTTSSRTPLSCSSLSAPSYCLISLLLLSLLLSRLFVTPVEANCAAVRPQHEPPIFVYCMVQRDISNRGSAK